MIAQGIAQGTDPWLPPAKLFDIPFEQYLEIDAASSSFLKRLLEDSPLVAKFSPDRETPSKSLGTVAHTLILEPHREGEITVRPADAGKNSNAAKSRLVDWIVETLGLDYPDVERIGPAGKPLPTGKVMDAMLEILEPALADSKIETCTQQEMDAAREMRDAVMEREICQAIFADGNAEVTMLAKDPQTDILIKTRVDWYPTGHHALVDLKTSQSCTFDEFAKTSARYSYHLQAALYKYVDRLVTKDEDRPFLHVVVRSQKPYDVAIWKLSDEDIKRGKAAFERALHIMSLCLKFNRWPGTGWDWQEGQYTIQSLSLPRWAK